MATAERMRAPLEQPVEKGLKPGALGLVSTTVIQAAKGRPLPESVRRADLYRP